MDQSGREVEPHEVAAFRREVRAWIETHKPTAPAFKMPQNFLFVETDEQLDFLRNWQRQVYEAGYLGLDWPREYGGQGDPHQRQRIVSQEMNRAGAPFLVNTIGLEWAGPVILEFGSEEQKQRFIKPILTAEEIWCQGFSEPGAGSDLAGARARAERTEAGWLVSGHKVWTTLGRFSKWMILLARTDPQAGKYEGLSFFLFPMDAPGVTILPLVKMTGEGGFNQVIFEKAPMPRDALLGKEGQGWRIAMRTLTYERGAAEGSGGGQATAATDSVPHVVALARRARRNGRRLEDDEVVRDRLAQLWIEQEAIRIGAQRARVPGLNVDRPLVLRLMNKLVYSEFAQRLSELACEILGPQAALWLGDPHAPDQAQWPLAYMNTFGMTIGGGTSEIQRNILGERVLGLPKSK
jgi:alkylation response protein AidB-like acyl-CoA dehydrogenase